MPLGMGLPYLMAVGFELNGELVFDLLIALSVAIGAVLGLAGLALLLAKQRSRELAPARGQLRDLGERLGGRVLEAAEGRILIARQGGRTLRVVLQRDGAMRYEVWLRGARGTFQASSPLFLNLEGYRGVDAVRIESAVLPLLQREGRVRLDSDRLLLTRPDGARELRMERVEITLGLLTALANLCDTPRAEARAQAGGPRGRRIRAPDSAAARALDAHAVRASGRPLAATRCPFCHDVVHRRAPDTAPCVECGALHHRECLAEGEGCAVYGCSSPLRVQLRV
ncbi:MAG TPA: hypothetical protein DEA08_33355 [Planctomycetes bacterium]|nr:hypothetical protein [Planctomycetota bacterium]